MGGFLNPGEMDGDGVVPNTNTGDSGFKIKGGLLKPKSIYFQSRQLPSTSHEQTRAAGPPASQMTKAHAVACCCYLSIQIQKEVSKG